MNISTLLFSFALFCLSSYSQDKTDSTQFYRNELRRLERAYEDSFRNSPRTKELSKKLKYAAWASDYYSGISIFTQIASADYEVLNADNAMDGFPPISGPMVGIGLGITMKGRRVIYEFGGAIGLNKKTTKGSESITTSVTPIQMEYGYDLVKKKSINVFPYLGLTFRIITLEYKTTAQLNPTPNSIASLVQNNRSVKDRENEFGYLAGIGFEYVIPVSSRASIPVFVKFGTNRAISKKSLYLEGYLYNPNIQYGNWTLTVGIKLVSR